MIGDIHVHSSYSTDSDAPMEEVVTSAISMGLEYLCFTDHIDYDFPYEGVRFDFDVADYMETIRRLRDRYGGQIRLLAGVELGMQPHLGGRYRQLLRDYPFDFAIGSQHLVFGKDPFYPETFEGKTDAEVYRIYFEDLLEDIRVFHEFDTLGHLDYIVRYGHNRARGYSYRQYAEIIDEILKLMLRWNIAIEINTAGLRKQLGFPNPHPDILRRYREMGGTLVTLGSDAHRPHALGFGFDTAKEILRSCGFTHTVYYEKRKPVFVKL